MTAPAPIPEELLRFLDANVDSIEQLELLRLVGDDPERDWDVKELASQAQALPKAIAILEQRGLLKSEVVGSETRCRLGSLSPETEKSLKELLQFYRERPVTLIKIVYARNNESLKAFADSFRLRKEP